MTTQRGAVGVLIAVVVAALGAPIWTWCLQLDPYAIVGEPYQPMTSAHWLGTDDVGRDVFARLLFGARTSIGMAIAAATGAALVGGGLGALTGFVGGWPDEVLVRATEATMSLPKLPFILLLSAIDVPGGPFGRSVFLIGLLVLMAWPGPARLARACALQCRRAGFIDGSVALGASQWWIWRTHVWPRALPVVAVGSAADVAELILLESLLSYLGFGVPAPAPSLGNLLSSGLPSLFEAPHTLVAPGILTVGVVGALHVLADAYSDRFSA